MTSRAASPSAAPTRVWPTCADVLEQFGGTWSIEHQEEEQHICCGLMRSDS
jgi:hypothetical protein